MKTSVQKAMFFGAGFALGWLICKRKFYADFDGEVEKVREYYEKCEEATAQEEVDWFEEQRTRVHGEALAAAYNTMSEPKLPWDPNSKIIPHVPNEPVVISELEYTHSESEYLQYQMFYYPDEDELVNLDHERFDTNFRDQAVGAILTRFDDLRGESPVLFVRSPYLKMQFEIIRGDGPFAEPEIGDDG